jgi:hypothetical protein
MLVDAGDLKDLLIPISVMPRMLKSLITTDAGGRCAAIAARLPLSSASAETTLIQYPDEVLAEGRYRSGMIAIEVERVKHALASRRGGTLLQTASRSG